jgi:hypothetical protein
MPYTINGSNASVGSEPRIENGTMWVPLREVAEALGAKVDYEPSTGVALVYHGDNIITVTRDDASIDVNGTAQRLQAAPFVENGQAWVPVRFFNTVLGAELNVDLENKGVDLAGGTV